MKKNKGFTLIELLAVIVVLAVIALIATPIVLSLVNNAKEGAAESSATAYIKAVENGIMAKLINEPTANFKGTFTVSQDKNKIVSESGVEINVDVKGSLPAKGGVVTIDDNGTVTNATFNISNYEIECTSDKCKVKGKKEQEEEISYPSILEKAKTLVYDENGTCKTDGTTYNYMGGCYIKGANTSNYVWYNGFMWRIMGINSDSTVRLITDENVTTLSYGPENSALTYTINEGYIHDWLNEYFYNNLNSTKSIIKEGAYFCSESTNEETLTEGRKICTTGNEVTTKVGLLAYDEYLLANNTSSYLYIQQYSWTMTPYSSSNAHYISDIGISIYNIPVTGVYGVRPVINVSSDSNVTSGEGTTQSFYVLEEDKTTDVTGKISEKATSGEYVSLQGHTYRVVGKDDSGVKLILDGLYRSGKYYFITKTNGNSNIFTLDSVIGQELNGKTLAWLNLNDSDKIVETTYYQGDGIDYGATYIDALKQSNGVKAKVGQIRIGDIASCHSSTMLTENYTTTISLSTITKSYWTMNKYMDDSNSWIVGMNGWTDYSGGPYEYGLRPVITVRNDLDIASGSGTWKNPYQI